MKKLIAILVYFNSIPLVAQPTKPILLQTANVAMVLTVGNNQKLYQSYLGKKLPLSTLEQLKGGREVYLTSGMDNQFEPSIRMIHADGNTSLELRFVSVSVQKKASNISTTSIVLKDPVYPITVNINYTVYFNEDVITTSTSIKNEEKKTVQLT